MGTLHDINQRRSKDHLSSWCDERILTLMPMLQRLDMLIVDSVRFTAV